MRAFIPDALLGVVRRRLYAGTAVLVALFELGCQGPAREDARLETGSDSALPPVPRGVSFANIYLVETEPEPGVAVDTGFGCGDRLVPIAVPSWSDGLHGAISALLAQSDTLGLLNVLHQPDALVVDSVAVGPSTSHVHISGRLTLGGVCDHPRISEQLNATARAASTTDSIAFFVNGEPIDRYLSLRD